LALRDFIVERRTKLGLTQQAVADAVGRSQSYIAAIETAQRRVDAVELIQLAAALKFDAAKVIRMMQRVPD
jgi:transcriptional regulator with XRE-family HTH domain